MQVMGTPVLIEWEKFQPGTSFFIPCVDRKAMERFVNSEAARLRLDILCKQVIENRIFGLRVWRLDGTVPPYSPVDP